MMFKTISDAASNTNLIIFHSVVWQKLCISFIITKLLFIYLLYKLYTKYTVTALCLLLLLPVLVIILTRAISMQFVVNNNSFCRSVSHEIQCKSPTGLSSVGWLPVNCYARIRLDTCCLTFFHSREVMRLSKISVSVICSCPALWIHRDTNYQRYKLLF